MTTAALVVVLQTGIDIRCKTDVETRATIRVSQNVDEALGVGHRPVGGKCGAETVKVEVPANPAARFG